MSLFIMSNFLMQYLCFKDIACLLCDTSEWKKNVCFFASFVQILLLLCFAKFYDLKWKGLGNEEKIIFVAIWCDGRSLLVTAVKPFNAWIGFALLKGRKCWIRCLYLDTGFCFELICAIRCKVIFWKPLREQRTVFTVNETLIALCSLKFAFGEATFIHYLNRLPVSKRTHISEVLKQLI